jgi:hypothetical protein
MPQNPDFFAQLSREELDALEKFAREPSSTVDKCLEWLLAHGYRASRSAVGRWKQGFDMRERFSRSRELAGAMKTAMEGGSFDDVAAAANMQLVNLVFEQSVLMQADEAVDGDTVEAMTRSLKNLVGTKAQHTKMLAEKFDSETRKLVAQKRALTQQDIDDVRKAVFG